MAYPALVSLSQTTDIILNYHQVSISPQVKHLIISINEYAIFLQEFVQQFPDKANNLEPIIRDVAHVVEDIVEYFMSKHIHEPRYSVEPPQLLPSDLPDKEYNSWLQTVLTGVIHLLTMRKPPYVQFDPSVGPSKSELRYDFHHLKEATEEIEWIAAIVMKLKSSICVKEETRLPDSTVVRSSTSRLVAQVHKDAMVGFEKDSMEIKSRLCGASSKLQVIPIVGMGGIGKTTLTRNVYEDPLITEYFDIRDWVTVSQDYSVQEIISNLLISMKVFAAKNKSMAAHHVYQHLKGRRYLIVLDDVWSTEAIDDLNLMFPDDGNGSRIMITTRLSDVASYSNSASPVHKMHLMDMDLSWKLLQQKVFKTEQCPVELEEAGKAICRSCRGLPLAVVLISGILSSIDHTATASWDNIAKNVRTHISADNEQLDKILSLSYTHLPHHLRPCFLYMGSFHEDYEVRVSKLVKLWAAEGFLKPNGCNKSLEEIAEENLEDLVRRSLVLVTRRKSDGKIKSLSMHDLTREMCIRISQQEKFLHHGHMLLQQVIDKVHHVSTIPCLDLPENCYGLTIRTILLSGLVKHLQRFALRDFRLLRILDLLDVDTPPLPAQVSELFHLRFLAFNGLFSSVLRLSNLQNLQTLIIYPSTYGKILPYNESDHFPLVLDIWNAPQLRHLVLRLSFCFCLPPHQQGAKFCLENLQTLSLAINFICTREILETIPNLKRLKISYSACRDDEEDYQLHNLIHLQHLENLKLEIHEDFPFREKVNPVFPITLKKLSLSGVRLPWEDMKIVGSLPNLEVLKLRDDACKGETWETAEGEFCELSFLLIDGSELQDWITESSHFPKLMRLVLHHCHNLREIPNEIGDVPTLELIEVDADDLLKSAKQIQEEQQSYGNEALQVRIVK